MINKLEYIGTNYNIIIMFVIKYIYIYIFNYIIYITELLLFIAL